jgi:fused signal recognition particle receptor
MFSFFKKKPPVPAPAAADEAVPPAPVEASSVVPGAAASSETVSAPAGWLARLRDMVQMPGPAPSNAVDPPHVPAPPAPAPHPPTPVASPSPSPLPASPEQPTPDASATLAASLAAPVPPPPAATPKPEPTLRVDPRPAAAPYQIPVPPPPAAVTAPALAAAARPAASPIASEPVAADRVGWLDKLRSGLRKTGNNIAHVFVGAQIDESLYEELETALLMADTGVKATEFLLADVRRRVRDTRPGDAAAVKLLLADAIAELLRPLEAGLSIGEHTPTVIMVVGVNGAGKTTTIGKLTRHLADAQQKVLLAAADTFRAAAREQLSVWAGRNQVEIVSQEGGDPAAVTFDAVLAGRSRGCDVVIADTAGRLTTQVHLMEELKKIQRVIGKAQAGAPHEVLLVVDGNTGQNALSQVQLFDQALGLTGLVVTKLDGTAKGGVLAAIALWARGRPRPIPVYFIGVGEKLEDLQTFKAREFATALLG